ncbi:hypothetical protein DPMN_110235 [Dreissena polymorpha]|uniref:Uncharacterized protein n=1 Tax=Dreissena polymorpha TaxID=45954 RepID=A0A9D4KCA5_DREPO|nr:hypothetical protein DPMN_110235 [Dreissena polymorpha]
MNPQVCVPAVTIISENKRQSTYRLTTKDQYVKSVSYKQQNLSPIEPETTREYIRPINILTKFHKDWMKTINILTKFHKDWMKTVTSIVYTSDLINILTKFHKDWMKSINILTKFHKDWMKTVTSIVYTSDLINILTKFHKDWVKTGTSTVYTNKLLTDTSTHNGRRTSHGHIISPSSYFKREEDNDNEGEMRVMC